MDVQFLPNWNTQQLELGVPTLMDTVTLIEWIQQQLETERNTYARHEERRELHRLWHINTPGIFGCCINAGVAMLFTTNERRQMGSEALYRKALDAFESYKDKGLMVLPEGMSVSPIGTYDDSLKHIRIKE